jgi:hypothetical protein
VDDATVAANIKAGQTWFQAHERLVIVALVLLVGCWLGNKYLDNAALDAKTRNGVAQQEASAAKNAADIAGQQYAATIAALTQQNLALSATINQRQVYTQQKVADVTAPTKTATDAISDIGTAYDRKIDVSIEPTGRLSFPVPEVQQFTATKIERDADEATIADQVVVIKNQQVELDKGATLVSSLKAAQVTSDTACKTEVAQVKANANKSKRTWFIIGFAAGLGTRILAHW